MSSGADTLANTLMTSLIAGKDFSIPDIELTGDIYKQPSQEGLLYTEINKISIEELTSGKVGGTGAFDRLMVSLVAHLKVEYEAGRISGAEYSKVYLEIVTAALQSAQQFVLAKDQAYWQAILVQAQARAAEIETIRARIGLEADRIMATRAKYEAATAEANYALTKMKLSTEDATYDNLTKQGTGIAYTNTNMLPKQVKLIEEQTEAQRAQTLDSRTDGQAVKGTLGKQKDLHTQQIDSYKRDAETKAAKIFSDAWITQKTIDEGLIAPSQFTNTQIDVVFTKLRSNLALN